MKITVTQESGVTLIRISGSLDSLTCDDAQAVFEERIKNNEIKMVVDFSEVDYLSSAGLRVLLPALKGARQRGGDLYLVGLQDNIRKVLSLAGFASIFKTYSTLTDAVGAFASR